MHNTLPALIERVLTERDWSLSQLARRCDLPTSTLHSWKSGDRANGSRGPSPESLKKLADGAGLTLAEVFDAAGRRVDDPTVDTEERRFLRLFHSISPADRYVIEATMRAMLKRPTE
jgi:transcriptional regulator with XRE-family HTH domain